MALGSDLRSIFIHLNHTYLVEAENISTQYKLFSNIISIIAGYLLVYVYQYKPQMLIKIKNKFKLGNLI